MARADTAREDPKLRLDRLLSQPSDNSPPAALAWLGGAKASLAAPGRVLDRLLSGLRLPGQDLATPSSTPDTHQLGPVSGAGVAAGEVPPAVIPGEAAAGLEARISGIELTLQDQTSVLGRLVRAVSAVGEAGTDHVEEARPERGVFRRDASRFTTGFPPAPAPAEPEVLPGAAPTTFRDSRVDRRRQLIIDAFGAAVDDDLIGQAATQAQLARKTETAVSTAIDDLVAARWIVDDSANSPLTSAAAQMRALAAFVSQLGAGSRSAFELRHAAELVKRLRKIDLGETSIDGVRLNALLAIMAVQDMSAADMSKALETAEGRTLIMRKAVLDGSARADFSALLDRTDRTWLQSASRNSQGVPLMGRLLWSDSGQLKGRFDLGVAADAQAFTQWLWSLGVWRTGLSHLAPAEHFEAGRLSIQNSTLKVPSHLEDAWTAAVGRSDGPPTRRQAVEDTAIIHGGFPVEVIDGSVFEARREPRGLAASETHNRPGRRRIELNRLVSFGKNGDSDRHTIGPHWSAPESDHRWTLGHSAILAFDLDAIDASAPLDLQIAFHLGYQPNQRVTIRWNGNVVWKQHVAGGNLYHARAYLGREHRGAAGPNILTISNSALFLPSLFGTAHDPRSLGVAVRHLVLSPR
jgi:hypothetical protein